MGTSLCWSVWSCRRSSSGGIVRSWRPSPKSGMRMSGRISSRRWDREPQKASCLHDRDSLRANRGASADTKDVRAEGSSPSAQEHKEHQAIFARRRGTRTLHTEADPGAGDEPGRREEGNRPRAPGSEAGGRDPRSARRIRPQGPGAQPADRRGPSELQERAGPDAPWRACAEHEEGSLMAEPMHCYRHPKRETRVSCATCGRPICTECMVATDVGIKCPEDARLPRGARAGVMKTNQLLWTIFAGLGVPVAWLLFRLPLTLLLSAAAGYGAGTLINRAGGRNGGPVAIAVSVLATAVPFLVILAPEFLSGHINPYRLIALVIAAIAAGVANR